MKNSISDHHMFIHSNEDDDNSGEEAHKEEGGSESEDSNSISSSPRAQPASRPNSYTTNWPQSYRQSIDMFTTIASPNIGFLGTPSLSRLSNSFLSSSFHGIHPPEIISSLIKPLLSSTSVDHHQQQLEEEIKQSTHSLTARKSSLEKIPEAIAVSHEFPTTGKCTFSQAVLNAINVLCGVGLLSAPYAVRQGGWLGLIILFVFTVLSYHTGLLLRYCLDSREGLQTYPDIGQAAFGTTGRFVISIILYMELYAICVEYIILESDNLSLLFPNAQLNIGSVHINSHVLFAVLIAIIVLPTTWLRDLSILSYISAWGVVACILIVLSLIWHGVFDVGFHHTGTSLHLSGMPIALGIYGYCYSGHAVFPNIYSSMKKPHQYEYVLFTSFVVGTVLFVGVAIMGYAMFGDDTKSQFTLNMPPNLMVSKIAVWTTVVNPITKYALTLTPLALSLEELIPANYEKHSHIYAIMIRTSLVISTLLVGLSIPFFGLVMSLIGSLMTMLVTFILPCVCYLSISRGKITRIQASVCVFIVAVGVTTSTIGTVASISKIVQNLS